MTNKRAKRNDAAAVRRAIARAEAVLPGRPAADGERDIRWQAIIQVGRFIESQPEAVLNFALRWGKHAQADLRAAIATCLLEHLLDKGFDEKFPRIRNAALASVRFADTFSGCWWGGEATLPRNAARVEKLKTELARKHKRVRAIP